MRLENDRGHYILRLSAECSSIGFDKLDWMQMRESEKRKGGKRKNMGDDTEGHAMPGNRKPAKQGRR